LGASARELLEISAGGIAGTARIGSRDGGGSGGGDPLLAPRAVAAGASLYWARWAADGPAAGIEGSHGPGMRLRAAVGAAPRIALVGSAAEMLALVEAAATKFSE